MSIFSNLSRLSLGQLVRNACLALAHLNDAPKFVTQFAVSRFTDHSTRLADALRAANERAWKVIETALQDETAWEKIILPADDRAFAEAIRGFLANRNAFRVAALSDLRRAREEGLLRAGTLVYADLAEATPSLACLADPVEILDAERQVLEQIGGVLEARGCPNLAWLLNQRPGAEPLGVAVADYFFRRRIEEDMPLFQGLAFGLLVELLRTVRELRDVINTLPPPAARTETYWQAVTRAEGFDEDEARRRIQLANAAKSANWQVVLGIVSDSPHLVNSCRPGGSSFYSPLHQAARNGAPLHVVNTLIQRGAWRTLRNAECERPVDIARRVNHTHLYSILEPQLRRPVPFNVLQGIQEHFHSSIRKRIGAFVETHGLRLPELEPLLEVERPRMWFWVPGFAGNFGYQLVVSGNRTRLVSVSCGRGAVLERHVISSRGSRPYDAEPE